MALAYRFDRDSGLTLRSPRETDQGFLVADGFVSRPGIYEYANPDGSTRRELRPDEEVFDPESLGSFEGASVTNGHPPADRPVTADNVRGLEVGTVMGPGHRLDDMVAAPFVVKTRDAVRSVRGGKRQLSPGYRIDLDETPGIHPKYGPYHAVQRKIRVNHVAIVDRARGGSRLQLRMDGADVREQIDDPRPRGETMDKDEQIRTLQATVTGLERDLKQRNDSATEATARAEKAEAAVGPLNDRITQLETHIASGATVQETEAIAQQKVRADEAEAALRELDDRIPKMVRDRATLLHRAAAVMGPDFRMDDLTDRQIHASVVRRLDSGADVSDASDAFLQGQFETLIKLHQRTAKTLTRVSSYAAAERQDEVATVQRDDRQKKLNDFRNQWRKPLPNDLRARQRAGEGS